MAIGPTRSKNTLFQKQASNDTLYLRVDPVVDGRIDCPVNRRLHHAQQ